MTESPQTDPNLEETIDAAGLDTPRSGLGRNMGDGVRSGILALDSGSASKSARNMQLHMGSREKLSDDLDLETLARLRLVSILLFGGNLAFLIYGILFKRTDAQIPGLSTTVFVVHILQTMITGLVALRTSLGRAAKICEGKLKEAAKDAARENDSEVSAENQHQPARCKFISNMRLTGWHLRVSEILVFGGSAILFFLFTLAMLLNASNAGFLASVNGPWLLLIFTYALFMPNTWQRAAAVMVPLALCPLLAMTVAYFSSETFQNVLQEAAFRDALPTTALTMAFAALVAIHGVRTIRSLRKEAFQARQLGQYQLTRLLGSGGMGEVYEAEHLLLKRTCAIKVIKAEQAGDPKTLKRFEREVRSTAKLRHWNTVDIYDYGHTEDGTFYYVMEYLPGQNLQQLVDTDGPLPEARVAHLLRQICDALSEAHEAGMVHRDIKPANIFLTQFGNKSDVVKLLDFGLVRPLATSDVKLELTQQNAIVGSPLYMPPEQASGESADIRSDIYSVGVVAYFLLSGRPPFDGSNAMEVIMAHARKVPPPLDTIQVSDAMMSIVMRCLEKEMDDRFQSAEQLGYALSTIEADVAKPVVSRK